MNMPFYFENMPVYVLAEKNYILFAKYCLKNQAVVTELRSQLQRAASSILLNLAEGMGKYSKKDKKRFFTIARGSVHECVPIIRMIYIEKLISEGVFKEIYTNLDSMGRMLSALINAMTAK